jgi:hypothetical protein
MKLTLENKKLLIRTLFEQFAIAGYDFSEFIFVPASKFNYKKVLVQITELEYENEINAESTFLYSYPEFKQLLD